MSDLLTPMQVITSILRGSNVTGILWGSSASPFYQQSSEPPPAFPYVVFTIDPSSLIHTQQGADTGGAYEEQFNVKIDVYGGTSDIERVSAPMIVGSLYSKLDAYADVPQQLNGLNFECTQFTRRTYSVAMEEFRQPDGFSRIYAAHAEYDYWITTPYPIRSN